MNASEVVKRKMRERGWSQQKLSDELGYRFQSAVHNFLNGKKGMRVDNFVKALDVMGYDVIVVDRYNVKAESVRVELSADEEGGES